MAITLVAVVCAGMLCQDVVVPTDDMMAGKATDPIPMQYTEIMCRAHGLVDAHDWLTVPDSPQKLRYEGWHITKILCVPGKYSPPGAA